MNELIYSQKFENGAKIEIEITGFSFEDFEGILDQLTAEEWGYV